MPGSRRKRAVSGAAALVAAACLVGCGGLSKVWMRSGGSAVEASDDEMSCTELSEGGSTGARTEVGGVGFSVGTGGEPLGGRTDNFSQRSACLRNKGYRLISVTAEEDRALKAASGVEKEELWRKIQEKNGLKPAEDAASGPPPQVGAR